MTSSSGAAAAAGAAAASSAANTAAVARAIRASGAIVSLEPDDFLDILSRQQSPLVIRAEGGFFRTTCQYLTTYKGLTFYTEAPFALSLPDDSEIVQAGKIWIP
jgi:hypothetical protein